MRSWSQSDDRSASLHPQYTEEAPLPLVGVVPAPPSDTPPAFHSREKCLFCHDFETYFYILSNFFNLSNLAQWSMTHISVVWQTHNTNLLLLYTDFNLKLNTDQGLVMVQGCRSLNYNSSFPKWMYLKHHRLVLCVFVCVYVCVCVCVCVGECECECACTCSMICLMVFNLTTPEDFSEPASFGSVSNIKSQNQWKGHLEAMLGYLFT